LVGCEPLGFHWPRHRRSFLRHGCLCPASLQHRHHPRAPFDATPSRARCCTCATTRTPSYKHSSLSTECIQSPSPNPPIPQVLHVRDYPRASLCELCEQSLHAFVSFSTVACSPPALKVRWIAAGCVCAVRCGLLGLLELAWGGVQLLRWFTRLLNHRHGDSPPLQTLIFLLAPACGPSAHPLHSSRCPATTWTWCGSWTAATGWRSWPPSTRWAPELLFYMTPGWPLCVCCRTLFGRALEGRRVLGTPAAQLVVL